MLVCINEVRVIVPGRTMTRMALQTGQISVATNIRAVLGKKNINNGFSDFLTVLLRSLQSPIDMVTAANRDLEEG